MISEHPNGHTFRDSEPAVSPDLTINDGAAETEKLDPVVLMRRLQALRHLSAIATVIAQNLPAEYLDAAGLGAIYVIKTAEGNIEKASETVVFELVALLEAVGFAAREQVRAFLAGGEIDPTLRIEHELLLSSAHEPASDYSAKAVRVNRDGRRASPTSMGRPAGSGK